MSVPFMGTELETTASKQQALSCWAHTGRPVALLGWTLTTRLCVRPSHRPHQGALLLVLFLSLHATHMKKNMSLSNTIQDYTFSMKKPRDKSSLHSTLTTSIAIDNTPLWKNRQGEAC